MEIDLEPLREAIRKHKLMESWADSLSPLSDEEKRKRAVARALEARDKYLQIMRSPKNNGTAKYRDWAIKKALGLRISRGYTAQAIGGKHWRAWGKSGKGYPDFYEYDDPGL